MRLRMCDDEGMVSHDIVEGANLSASPTLTYLRLFNNLHGQTRSGNPTWEPFHCTGSAHLAGEHILCTSPAHQIGVTS